MKNSDVDLYEVMTEKYDPREHREQIIQETESSVRAVRMRAASVVAEGVVHGMLTDVHLPQELEGIEQFAKWCIRLLPAPLHVVMTIGEPVRSDRPDLHDVKNRAMEELLHREVMAVFTYDNKSALQQFTDHMSAAEKGANHHPVSMIFVSG